MNKKSLLLSFICLFLSIYSFSQIHIISFERSPILYSDWPRDDNGNPISIINIEATDLINERNLDNEELQLFLVYSEMNSHIVEYNYKDKYDLKDKLRVCFTTEKGDNIIVSHPSYGFLEIPSPTYPGEYELVLSCQRNTNSNTQGNSFNVIVYDINGQQYMTGLFIRSAGKSYIRLQKGHDGYDQYILKESDKEEYKYMTTGESKIEPLYVK